MSHLASRPRALLLVAPLLLAGCSKDDDDNDASGAGRLEVRLTDAPGNYDQVNVDVQGVEIHVTDANEEANWQPLRLLRPGVINLLDLADGRTALLASADLPAGTISQLRLKLGSNNSVKLKGDPTIYALQTPSAQQSGLKLRIDATLERNVTYQVLLDFDAGRSVVEKGNGQNRFSLKPVIRTVTSAIAGGVQGQVAVPDQFQSSAWLISVARDTVSTGISPVNGQFLFRGIVAGTYTLALPGAAPRDGQTKIQTVSVDNSHITDVGTINW